MKTYEIALARTAHIAFYVLLFAIPLSGWALATAASEPLTFFGLFEVPQLRIAPQLGALSEDQWPVYSTCHRTETLANGRRIDDRCTQQAAAPTSGQWIRLRQHARARELAGNSHG